MQAAEMVVALTPFKNAAHDVADVLLPIAPFTETPGTFVSMEGRAQSFYATVNPLGEARPAWKVLRVLGTLRGTPGFEFETIEQVRAACLQGRDIASLLSNRINLAEEKKQITTNGIQRIADVPIYFADPLVRRSAPLQKTKDAEQPRAWMNARLMEKLGVSTGQRVLVKQGTGQARLACALDDKLPDDCVRVAAAHASTAALGPMFGTVSVEKVSVQQAA
jgi:NADH-quinone oxidoreductase subunit G